VRWARRVLEARGIAARFLRENLEQIGEALATRLDGNARPAVQAVLRAGIAACDERPGEVSPPGPEDELAAVRRLYLQAVLRGQRNAACGIVLESHRAGHPLLDIYIKILQPVQYEVGRLWEHDEITVAEEHMATAITQSVMAQLYPLLPPRQPRYGRIVLTGVEGELHQIGVHMVADVLEAHGWEVRFLGTNMPHASILRVIEEQRPDAVGISATMLFNLSKVRNLIEQIRTLPAPQPPRIVVGGAAFRAAPGAWREVGADACGFDLEQAIGILCGETGCSHEEIPAGLRLDPGFAEDAKLELHRELVSLNNELAVMARERGQALARAQRAEQEHERLLASERQARAEAEEANRRKDDILAMVSHDLRTPLSAIFGWARLLASGRLGAEETARALEAILRNAETQERLIEDLLDLARVKTGKLRLNPRPTDTAKVVDSILDTTRPAAEANGISLQRVVTDAAALRVLADPVRLEQALGNLVSNAVKFTPKGGYVEVRLGQEGDSVVIRVQDTGEGIEPALLPYIFDRFRQGKSAGPERTSGLGLGLAIARDLIELQGGTIEAASDGPGRGTTFTVKLHRLQ
jgi:signal transduction histidine kinase